MSLEGTKEAPSTYTTNEGKTFSSSTAGVKKVENVLPQPNDFQTPGESLEQIEKVNTMSYFQLVSSKISCFKF